MNKYIGQTILRKIAIGRIKLYHKKEQSVQQIKIDDPEKEWKRFEKAKEKASEQLAALYEKALKEVGKDKAAIFEIYSMMLEDEGYLSSVRYIIETQMVNAEYAAASAGEHFAGMLAESENEYFKSRSEDIRDISARVVRILMNSRESCVIEDEPVILAAEDLTPGETVQLDKSKLLGFVTESGSSNSHTAILARTMNIPALIGIPIQEEWDGKIGIIDGYNGIFIADPDMSCLEEYQEKQKQDIQKAQLLQRLKGRETVTADGRKIHLYANIGNAADVAKVMENDAEGIGLFRSEFLYLEKKDYPTEEEQFQSYKQAAEMMAGKKVIIRTLDIGADKQVDYFKLEKEENPAMGFRAIRICLERPEVFKTQLRAIYRASAFGTISIMFPMIISLEEVLKIKVIVEEVKAELKEKNVPMGEVELGIMIETPAAALISDELAKEVDFFSIGTNDLTQYTLAIDRQNARLDPFMNTHHKAVLRLIQMVIDNGHKNNCWVGICGELGADLTLTETFVKMGIDELSVSAGMVLRVREAVCNIGRENAEEI